MATLPEEYGVVPERINDKDESLSEYLDQPPVIFDYIIKVTGELEDSAEGETDVTEPSSDHLSFSDADYMELLLQVDSQFQLEDLFFDGSEVPDKLARSNSPYSAPDLYEQMLDVHNHLAFSAFAALMLYHISNDNSESAQSVYEEYEALFNDNRYGYLMKFFESYIIHKHHVDPEYDNITTAIELAYESKRKGPNHYLLQLNFSESVATAFESDPEFEPSFTESDLKSETIIDEASQAADQAEALEREYARTYVVKLRLNLINNEHEEARENLEEAVRYDQQEEVPILTQDRKQQLRRSINIVYDSVQLKEDIAGARDDLTELKEDLSNAVNEYRKNTLRFIGFFAALITFAITSVQILAVSNLGVQQAGRVIAMLAGGMLIAFGGFGWILPVYDHEMKVELSIRTGLVTVLGILVFAVSYFVL
ncbi:hypothetical protein [Salinibaculum rarum]|uniref:hypothetical protein n=1 Tax=Salinibaculum rarum TaxID=3058903 RepID=UPI00265FE83E|nr:hypothetical protein [Salinibaculum sp. KK48]